MTSKKDTEDPKTNGSEEEEENEDEEEKEEITYTKAALFGKMDFEYPRTARVVRIYIHSAGKDTELERAYLKKRSYPKLRRYCRQRGCDFHVIDLHTCDADQYMSDHVARDICRKEIEKCMDLSIGPHFLTFLGQKYGKPSLPARIDYDIMKRYLKQLSSSEKDKELLLKWYILDENSSPLAYVLSPVSALLFHYANGTDADTLAKWLETVDNLLTILREVSSKKPPKGEEAPYQASAAEEELKWCLPSEGTPNDAHVRIWFRRDVTDLLESTADDSASSYIDLEDGQVDEDAQESLKKLRETTMSEMFPDESTKSFEIGWDALFEEEEKTKYLENLRESFEETITDRIDKAIENMQQFESDIYSLGIIRHMLQAQKHVKNFIGRKSFIDQIEETLREQERRVPLILYGERGCGKSGLISKLATMIPEWYWLKDFAVVLRTHETDISWNTRELLTSLCAQIHLVNDELNLVDDIPRDYEEIQEYFIQQITRQKELKNTILILLDVLDVLPIKEAEDIKKWMPQTLPKKVLFIVTVTKTGKLWKAIKKHYSDSLLPISDLDAEDMTDMVQELLKGYGRALQGEQWEMLEEFCPSNPTPFHMNIAANTAMRWQDKDTKKKLELPEDVEEVVTQHFEKLEEKHGADYVNVVFGCLSASCEGLSLAELEYFVAKHPNIPGIHRATAFPGIRTLPLLYLLYDAGFYITEKEVQGSILYRWKTKGIADMAKIRYLPDETKEDFHNKLFEYFTNPLVPPDEADAKSMKQNPYAFCLPDQNYVYYDTRVLTELLHQLFSLKKCVEITDSVLLNLEYLQAKMTVTSVEQVISEFTQAEEVLNNVDIRAVQTCLNNNKAVLAEHSSALPLCLLQQLTKSPDDMSGQMEDFLNQAKSPGFDCLLSSLVRIPLDKDYANLGKFSGATEKIQSIDISSDGSKCLAVSQDNHLRVWDIEDQDEILELELEEYEPYLSCEFLPLARFCNDDDWAVLASTTILNFFDIDEEELVHRIELTDDAQLIVAFIDDLNQIFVVGESEISVWDIKKAERAGSLNISKPIEIEDQTLAGRVEDYIGTHNNDVIFHRAGGTVVKVIHHNTDRKTDSYALYGKKEAEERVVRFALTSSGMLICYHFVPPTPTADNAAPSLEGTIDVVDTETVAKVHTFEKQDGGLFITLERVFPLGENLFGVLCHPVGSTILRVYDIASQSVKEPFALEGDFVNFLASSDEGEAAFVTRNNPNDLELTDLTKALELKQQETYSGNKDPEAAEILYELPNTRRYVLFMTSDQALAVWDLAHRICVRILEIAFPGTYAAATSSTIVAGIDPESTKLMTVDMRNGEITERIDEVAYKIRDSHLRVGIAADGYVVLVGPKPNVLSGIDVTTGSVTWSCEVEDCECIGGVIVSDNGRIAICEVPDDTEAPPPEGDPTPTESKLFAFELKDSKRLPDLKMETTKPLSTRLVLGDRAFLTPEGSYYVTSASTERGSVFAVFDIAEGTCQEIRTLEEAQGITLAYSKALESCVIGYTDGKVRWWKLEDLEMNVMETGKLQPITRMFVSQDGIYAACFFKDKMHTLHLHNLKTKMKHGIYVSNESIISCFFTSQSEFLLVSREKVRGLTQLCIHTAFTADDQPAGDAAKPTDSEDTQGARKSSNTLAANTVNTRPSTGRKSAKSKRRRSVAASRRGSAASTAQADDQDKSANRRYVEETYLESMMKLKDLFGEPAEFECFD